MGSMFRLCRAGWVLLREGVLGLVGPDLLPPPVRPVVAALRFFERRRAQGARHTLSRAMTRLGPSYVKLGQFLATRPDVIGAAAAEDLARLQDRMAPFPQARAEEIVAASLKAPLDVLLAEFGPPVAAASIAQVHRASVKGIDGELRDVAVKVLRPDVEARFQKDLKTFYRGASIVLRLAPASRRLRPAAVVDLLARSVAIEMDLRLEAAALSEMAENVADDPGFAVPRVYWPLCAKNVLVTSWVDGAPLMAFDRLEAAGHSRPDLARTLIQSFLRHALRDGFFHADMHPGNLFVDNDGRIVAVDFGIMGRLCVEDRHTLAQILLGFVRRDYRRIARAHFEAGYVPADQSEADFAQALRAIGEPLHDRRAADISMASLLGQLFDVTRLFSMHTQPQLVLLQKTMVVVEGLARRLDPGLNMWTIAEPVVSAWVVEMAGPGARLDRLVQGLKTMGRLAEAMPSQAEAAVLAGKVGDGAALCRGRSARQGAEPKGRRRRSFWRDLAVGMFGAALAALFLTLAR